MSQSLKWRVAIGIALGSLAVGLSGCEPVASSGPETGAHCSVRAHNPHASHGTPGSMTGKADIRCSGDLDNVTLIAKLQVRRGGRWVDVSTHSETYQRPIAGKKYVATAATPCDGGTFRTAGRGYGYLNGVRSGSARWTYSREVKDPCR